jgi:uncharacterized membrane protein
MHWQQIVTPLDLAALAYFIAAVGVYRLVVGAPGAERRSMSGAVQAQRVAWMLNMARRAEHRTMDVILLNNLAQGNAFFASTTAIAIGGIATLMGSGDRAQSALERIPYAAMANPILWELKLVTIMTIFVFAFFKFAWAFRLGHYTAIMIGATPLVAKGTDYSGATEAYADCDAHAERTARLAGLSAEHSNSGLRAFYYAIAVLAWFYHPVAFIVATTWVIAIQTRRDFFSRSRRLIAGPIVSPVAGSVAGPVLGPVAKPDAKPVN